MEGVEKQFCSYDYFNSFSMYSFQGKLRLEHRPENYQQILLLER